jgi:SAM-dependent methyltransferase
VDTWKFYGITHRYHVVCNPLSLAKVDEIVGLLDLPGDGRILDIACGKGELLVRIVERYGVFAVGVDLSPQFVHELRQGVAARADRGGRVGPAPPRGRTAVAVRRWGAHGMGGPTGR